MTNDGTTAHVLRLPPCDMCQRHGVTRDAEYDSKTTMGPWGFLCGEHFEEYGTGLGLGVGQKLIVETGDNELVDESPEDPNRFRKPKDIDTERLTQEDEEYGWGEETGTK
jgi:hypothetical protein